jgi:hypothetical protein
LSFSEEDDKKDISDKIFDEAKTNNFIISEERRYDSLLFDLSAFYGVNQGQNDNQYHITV